MDESSSPSSLQPDAKELLLCQDDRFICESYIFEPSPHEEHLGHLFAVGEIEERDGVGRELLDLVTSAIQREYYRDPSRSAASSFEMALHQANLILHDSVEQGLKDWMGYFHVAVGVLSRSTIHISVAGNASVMLARKSSLTNASSGLATFPVTNPLRTFSQVASGVLAPRDVLFFGTSNFGNLFRSEDVVRFSIEHSASTITTRLHQLYTDQHSTAPLAVLVVAVLPQYVVQPREEPEDTFLRRRSSTPVHHESLRPRQPLTLNRSWLRSIFLFIGRVSVASWRKFRQIVWPRLIAGSQQSGRFLFRASQVTGRHVKHLSTQQLNRLRKQPATGSPAVYAASPEYGPSSLGSAGAGSGGLSAPRHLGSALRRFPAAVRHWFSVLPRTSRIMAAVTLLFAGALIVSLLLLQQKRQEDESIRQASEALHAARTKKEAAATALIYDNRDQAIVLLSEADQLTDAVAATGFYTEEVASLQQEIEQQHDRLQKVTRSTADNTRIIGDFQSIITQEAPRQLYFIDNVLYTYNPQNNAIVKMGPDGAVSIASQTSQGIGFFTDGVVHTADKTITFATDAPGVALFDAKADTLLRQDITFASPEPDITAVASFGNRLYVYDDAADNIFSFNKTLRGYSGGEAWITSDAARKDTISDIAVDGNIFALHTDGTVQRLFKGEPAEFPVSPLDPPLASATTLLTREDLRYVYLTDPSNKRVVILTKEGALVQQLFIDVAGSLNAITVDPAETTLFALDGTRVLAIPFTTEAASTP